MDETEPLFQNGKPNPRRLGFFSVRSSAGDEPDPQRLQDAARLLGREPFFTDQRGYECELIAAAISASGDLAYVESRTKDVGPDRFGLGGRRIDISIRIRLLNAARKNRSVDIRSYNPFFGCDVRFFEWVGDTVVLIYREKHWTFACRFGDLWPPRFVQIEDDWILHQDQLAYCGYREELVRRLSFPKLEKLEPLTNDAAAKLGLLPGT